MRLALSDEAEEFGRHALRAIGQAGGDDLVREAERNPDQRATLAEPVLDGFGVWELDPRRDAADLEAAAALCRSAGWWALPYPLAERLGRPCDIDTDGLVVVDPAQPRAAVAGLDLEWTTVTIDGARGTGRAVATSVSGRAGAFVTSLDVAPLDDAGAADVALGLVLPCWTLLGMLDRALDLTRAHIVGREQFGQAIAAFQGAQFQLTDAEVARSGLEVLAIDALWSVASGRPDAVVDGLALRMAALEAAETALRISHQLHGALGFCDESTLSWLSRHSQPIRRTPFGLSHTRRLLADRARRQGLRGLFHEPAR